MKIKRDIIRSKMSANEGNEFFAFPAARARIKNKEGWEH